MAVSPVDKELSWDEVTKAVGQAVAQHLPEANATEAYYHLVVRHLAEVLWQLGSGHRALKALDAVFRTVVVELRPLVVDAPPIATRSDR
jgi:hypothetical protein